MIYLKVAGIVGQRLMVLILAGWVRRQKHVSLVKLLVFGNNESLPMTFNIFSSNGSLNNSSMSIFIFSITFSGTSWLINYLALKKENQTCLLMDLFKFQWLDNFACKSWTIGSSSSACPHGREISYTNVCIILLFLLLAPCFFKPTYRAKKKKKNPLGT